MKRSMIVMGLMLMGLFFSGCTQQNIESQAYAVSLGIDQVENGEIRVAVQIPTLGSAGSSDSGESGGGGGKGYTLTTANGRSLSEALSMLQASIPREMNLSGVKSIVVAEELASSDRFLTVLREMAMAYRVYGAAELIICRGEAKTFIGNQTPVIGLRLSENIMIELEHGRENGYIPDARASDVYYMTGSLYGDPMAVLAAVNEENSALPEGQMGDVYAGEIARTGENKNIYFGAALLKKGRMTGMLTGAQMQLVNMLLGELDYFGWIVDGIPVNLNPAGRPRVEVDVTGRVPQVDVYLTVNVLPSRKEMDVLKVQEELTDQLDEVTSYCQACGVDPFRYAERASGRFLTVQDWLEYDWSSRFPSAQVRYYVTARRTEL